MYQRDFLPLHRERRIGSKGFWSLLLSFVLLSITTGYAIETPSAQKHQMRAVWLTTNYGLDWPSHPATSLSDEAVQKRELIRILDQLQKLGTNTIFLQVRSRGTLIYPSEIEPMSDDFVPLTSGYRLQYDPLRFAIEECHKRGMVVHAWLAVIPMGSDRQIKNMPAWSFPHKHRREMVRYKRSWYLDPSKPSTSHLLSRIVAELLERYPVAGIHLDYIRYPDRAKEFDDQAQYRKWGGGKTLDDWRRDNIARLVGDLYKATKKSQPHAQLSASVIGTYNNVPGLMYSGWTAYNEAWQDPAAWCRDSIIDFVVPMMYSRGERFYPFVKEWQKVLDVPLVVGIAPYMILEREGNWPKEEIIQQINYLDSLPDIAGVALFRAEHAISNQIGIRHHITQQWHQRSTLPLDRGVRMAWLDTQDLTIEGCVEGLRIQWHGSHPRRVYALYLSTDGEIPHGLSTPYSVTTAQEVTIPWHELPEGELIGIKVSEYDLVSQVETLPFSGGLYYYLSADPSLLE